MHLVSISKGEHMKITVTFDALDEFNSFMGKQFSLVEPAPAQAPTGDWYPGGSTMDERELAFCRAAGEGLRSR